MYRGKMRKININFSHAVMAYELCFFFRSFLWDKKKTQKNSAINLQHLLTVATRRLPAKTEPLRLLIQGNAGVGIYQL